MQPSQIKKKKKNQNYIKTILELVLTRNVSVNHKKKIF